MGAAPSTLVAITSLGTALIHATVSLVRHFLKAPDTDNNTLQHIEEENRRRAEVEQRQREAEEREKRAKEAEERAKKAEKEAREREERFKKEAKEREDREREEREKLQREMEEQKKKAEQEARDREERYRKETAERQQAEAAERARLQQEALEREAAHKREMEAREAESARQQALAEKRRKLEEEKFKLEAELLRQNAELERQKAEEAKALADRTAAEAKKFYEACANGIRPVKTPTAEEVRAAKEKMKYDSSLCHFAICGPSGSGKSSLINAFRGLSSESDAGYAKTDVVECTSIISRYPDPRPEIPFKRFVWYDIPGAGTLDIPDWQYFNDQGLFCYDFIIMIYDGRFTAIDAAIIKNCKRFNIPLFVVRSKSDQHINNLFKVEDNKAENEDLSLEELYEKAKHLYISATRTDFEKNIEKLAASTLEQNNDTNLATSIKETDKVYIVSSHNLLTMFGKPKKASRRNVSKDPGLFEIDEAALVKDLLKAAVDRRYGSSSVGGETEEDDGFTLVELAEKLPKLDGFLEMLHRSVKQ